ncbi:MAG: hypothetical protein JO325_14655 [Solirubrobacterales bacterium]|nr:hypothetical protein [Solirubrobacterales bacterium]
MSLRAMRALLGLVNAAAALALPAAASAAVTPALTVTPTTVNAGASPAAVNVHATFTGGTPDDVTFSLPSGLLANANQAGGACLILTTPSAACQVGSGTVTAAGAPLPVSLYLVAAPRSGDAAGIALVQGSTTLSTADVIIRSTDGGLNIAFSNLASDAISDLNASFTTLRLPTSCPTPAANVTLTADGATTTAPLNVTGCSGLPYNPMVTTTETKDAKDDGAALSFAVTQAADEAATKSIAFKLPSGLGVNLSADLTCLVGAGSGCDVGTASATSPIVPNVALAHGTVVLGGSGSAPTITVSFPAPFALTLVGDISQTNRTVTFNNLPDLPLTTLNLNITGPNGDKAFTTECQPSSASGTFTSQSGVVKTVNGTVKLVNCAAAPTATGSFSGLAGGTPGLRFTVTHGKGAPNVSSVSVGLPRGLRFSRAGIVMSKTCTIKGGQKKCTTTTLTKGLGIKGATAESVALRGGKLLITLKKPVGKVTISLGGPVLAESGSLQPKVKKHKVKSLTVTVKVSDAKGTTTPVPLKLRAR